MRVHCRRDSDRPASLHYDRIAGRDAGNLDDPVHDGRTCATEGDHLLRRQIVMKTKNGRAGLEVDRLGPSAGESRKFIEALIDTVDLTSLAKCALAGDDAPIALTAGNIGRPGNGIAFAQRIPGKISGHTFAQVPNAPDPFMSKHDR